MTCVIDPKSIAHQWRNPIKVIVKSCLGKNAITFEGYCFSSQWRSYSAMAQIAPRARSAPSPLCATSALRLRLRLPKRTLPPPEGIDHDR
jgi:hypothetical protein